MKHPKSTKELKKTSNEIQTKIIFQTDYLKNKTNEKWPALIKYYFKVYHIKDRG